jgi:hypothetical protein
MPPWGLIALGLAAWSTAAMAWLLSGRAGLFAVMGLDLFAEAGGLRGWPLAWVLPLALAAWFLACAMLAWLVLRVGAWLDRQGRVMEALAWPLRSRLFVVASLAWMLLAGTVVLMVRPGLDGSSGLVLFAAAVLAGMLLPFVALRPELLDRPRPSPIVGLHWPGWRAVLIGVGCVLVAVLSGLAEAWLDPVLPGLVLIALDDALTAAGLLLMLLVWFNGGRFAPIVADLRRLPRGDVIRELVAFAWLCGLVTVFLGMPVLAAAAHTLYVAPELGRTGASLPWSSTVAVWLTRDGKGISQVAVIPLAWYLALAEGRWARSHGIGRHAIAEACG